jgi:hypothetical protein
MCFPQMQIVFSEALIQQCYINQNTFVKCTHSAMLHKSKYFCEMHAAKEKNLFVIKQI